MAKKTKKEKDRLARIERVLIAMIIILVMILLGLIWFIWDKFGRLNYDDGKIDEGTAVVEDEGEYIEGEFDGLQAVEGAPKIPTMKIYKNDDVQNILLIGTDERGKKFSTKSRSDSMMILSLDKKKGTVKLVSLERATGVPILKGTYKGQYDWLTHTFNYGGADLLMEEVRECYRVDLDRYVRVNFYTLKQIVDSMGGLDITLTGAEAGYINADGECKTKGARKGENHLDGEQVLSYARMRKIDSDWGRMSRQRNVIKSAIGTAKSMSIVQLNGMLNTVLPLVQTNLTKSELASLMMNASDFVKGDYSQMALPIKGTFGTMKGMGGRSLYAVDFTENATKLREFLYEHD